MRKNMKRFRILILSFLFMFLVSFTNGITQEPTYAKDSTVIHQVQFENPRILIDDYRSFQAWREYVESDMEVDSAMRAAFERIGQSFDQYVAFQERRYESAMDYMTRRTGYSLDEIEAAYARKRRIDIFFIIGAVGSFLIAMVTAFSDSKKYKRRNTPQRQFMQLFVNLLLSAALLTATYYLLLFTVNYEYHHINQLLNLSG